MSNVFYLSDYRDAAAPDAESASPPPLGARKPLGLRRTVVAVGPQRQPPPPEDNALQQATPVLLFHVSYGRNAWHSTWIARYERNTLMPSHDAAHAFVAKRLKQGSAFRLTVMPGWHLQFDGRAYLVCEINSNAPFTRLRAAGFAIPGVTEAEALALLKPTSELWRGAQPQHDSVIVQETTCPASDFIAWENRTAHPGQVRTPGRYERVIDGKHWWFRAVKGNEPPDYDTTAFAALLAGANKMQAQEEQ